MTKSLTETPTIQDGLQLLPECGQVHYI